MDCAPIDGTRAAEHPSPMDARIPRLDHRARHRISNGSLDTFRAHLNREALPDEWPLAMRVERNVPLYAGSTIRSLDSDGLADLEAEWAACLLEGPGVFVIRKALPDHDVIDRATTIFEHLIETEAGEGDHFAAAGANDRVWNAAQKHCLADPMNFARYYGNVAIAAACRAWLGPNYQVTAQVNRVNPGGAAQCPHRDYHLGFMSPDEARLYPAHVHTMSPRLTLQGGIAHHDVPVEQGPTMLLPFSQTLSEGYVAFTRAEFRDVFAERHIQLPLTKGDALFFNPALMHGAGENRTDRPRLVNLLQVSSAFGRAMEALDRTAMCAALYPVLLDTGLTNAEREAAIAACAEGYAFPTNLDTDPPVDGMAPRNQANLMRDHLARRAEPTAFEAALQAMDERRRA